LTTEFDSFGWLERKDEVVKKNCKAIFLFDEGFSLFTHVKRELKNLGFWVKKYFLTQPKRLVFFCFKAIFVYEGEKEKGLCPFSRKQKLQAIFVYKGEKEKGLCPFSPMVKVAEKLP